ncbi:MAG: rod shape-determining protein RodA, partial [Patescibacteria group bacterium]|nr:rod shape-determining protein RodA [Patescibacteria group bacterium]
HHLMFLGISLIFFIFFSFLDLEILFPFSPIIYIGCLLFLILPFIVGTVTRGSVRWIPLAGFTIQPSELVKPFLALMAAWFWTGSEFSWKKILTFIFFSLPILFLIFIQPDLGSTLVVFSIFIGIIFLSGIELKKLIILFCGGILVLPLFFLSLKGYQRLRLVHFLNPYTDPLGEGYNLIQSKIAVGSGGIFGRGLGRGTQSHLAFLPERHTDFIFASLSEELGFGGATLVLLLYLFLYLRVLKVAFQVKERRFFLFSLGLFFYLFFQTTVNIGMNVGLLPITGITLPLISYGGSSLLTTMISLGMLQAVSRQRSGEKVLQIH